MHGPLQEIGRSPHPIPGELMIWLSPIFPVGAFAYSQGLETAADREWVTDFDNFYQWLEATSLHGVLRNDLILLSLVMRAEDDERLHRLAELSAALQPSAERAKEASDLGISFWAAYCAAWKPGAEPNRDTSEAIMTLPIAVGCAARDHGLDEAATLEFFGISYLSNQISAAIRLGIIGQFDGQRILAGLLPNLRHLCAGAALADEDDLGTATFGADLCSMLHETQDIRLFRS